MSGATMTAMAAKWIDTIIAVCLLAMSPFFLFPRVRYTWVYAIVGALILARGALKRAFFEKTPLDGALCLMMLVVAVTCYASPDLTLSLGKVAGVLFGVLLFYVAAPLLRTERSIWLGLQGLTLVAAGFALVGLVDMDMYPEFYFGRKVLEAVTIPKYHWNLPGAESGISANALAGALLLVGPVVLLSVVTWRSSEVPVANRGIKWLATAAATASALVLLGVIFMSQSISAWAALPVSAWLVGFNVKWKIWALIGLLAVSLAVYSIDPLRDEMTTPTRANTRIDVKLQGRYPFWKAGIDAMKAHPFLGVGMNRLRADPRIGHANAHAHNQFLTTGAELGVAGLVGYLAVLLGAAWMSWESVRRATIRWMRMAIKALFAGQLGFVAFGLADAVPLGAKLGILFWMSLALIAALHRFTRQDRLAMTAAAI
jgi:O-antigen ligase